MSKTDLKKGPSTDNKIEHAPRSRTTPIQALLIMLASLGLFFGLLEGGLALVGVKPVLNTQDPFVGFTSNVPLFVPKKGQGNEEILVTAPNKRGKFNVQEFRKDKQPGTYRIFCMGGSTTYGRPYNDATSFAGWLRELLPRVDGDRNWEVINAGGVSYASYRVAHMMEEIVKYEPDLFIIYTGHNEFLEERTYRKLRSVPPLVRESVSLLARTRTWSAMSVMLQKVGVGRQTENEAPEILAADVTAKLDRSIGPESYTRNDPLREMVLEHYRISLERMVLLARSVGAQVVFVTPGSNLKDSSPFKSEHTESLDPVTIERSEQSLADARSAIRQKKWEKALDILDSAVAADPRHAELLYRRGKALLALHRFEEAEASLRLARDEDVCPLRALTPMRQIVSDVARENGALLIDYVHILQERMKSKYGHPIPGEEFFLDHVHPTIEGHEILAVALVKAMMEEGLVTSGNELDKQVIASVEETIQGKIDKEAHGQALTNLARVLLWAGKGEDAARLARQALDTAGNYPEITKNAASTLATYYQRQGYLERSRRRLYSALEKAPDAVELRLKLGKILVDPPYLQLDEAAAQLLWVSQQMTYNDVAYQLYGQAMARRGRLEIAKHALAEALRLNPKNEEAREALDRILPYMKEQAPGKQDRRIQVEVYASRAPRKLVQVVRDASGRDIPDGIEAEFYENGRVKSLRDIVRGNWNGYEIHWAPDGKVHSRIVKVQGRSVDLEDTLRKIYAAVEKSPDAAQIHLKLGSTLLNPPFLQLNEAAANLLLVCQQNPGSDVAFQLYGQAMARRGRFNIAYNSLMEALRLNPQNQGAQEALARIRPFLRDQSAAPRPGKILVETYPTSLPRKLVQMGHDVHGRSVPDGIEVEFYENGRVKRLVDLKKGVRDGFEIAWDPQGRILSSIVHVPGTTVN